MIEKETMKKVNRTITTLEAAIATWETAKEKPEDLKDRFTNYKRLHDALMKWERDVLKAMEREDKFDVRVRRLQEFVDICYAYA